MSDDIEFSAPASEPIIGSGTDIAFQVDTPEEFQAELARVNEEARDEAHDLFLARKVRAMEAAGATPDEIVDALVDDFAHGETW